MSDDVEISPAEAIISRWYYTDKDIHNQRTANIPKSAIFAIHSAMMLKVNLLSIISLPPHPKLKEVLERHYEEVEEQIEIMKEKSRRHSDQHMLQEAENLQRRLGEAKLVNTFVDLVIPIEKSIIDHVNMLISASSAVDGKTLYALLHFAPRRGEKFGLFSRRNEDGHI